MRKLLASCITLVVHVGLEISGAVGDDAGTSFSQLDSNQSGNFVSADGTAQNAGLPATATASPSCAEVARSTELHDLASHTRNDDEVTQPFIVTLPIIRALVASRCRQPDSVSR